MIVRLKYLAEAPQAYFAAESISCTYVWLHHEGPQMIFQLLKNLQVASDAPTPGLGLGALIVS